TRHREHCASHRHNCASGSPRSRFAIGSAAGVSSGHPSRDSLDPAHGPRAGVADRHGHARESAIAGTLPLRNAAPFHTPSPRGDRMGLRWLVASLLFSAASAQEPARAPNLPAVADVTRVLFSLNGVPPQTVDVLDLLRYRVVDEKVWHNSYSHVAGMDRTGG